MNRHQKRALKRKIEHMNDKASAPAGAIDDYVHIEVVNAMLDEIKTSMQQTIDALTQRNVTYRGTMKRLELHGTALESEVAALKAAAVETPPAE